MLLFTRIAGTSNRVLLVVFPPGLVTGGSLVPAAECIQVNPTLVALQTNSAIVPWGTGDGFWSMIVPLAEITDGKRRIKTARYNAICSP